MPAIVSRHRLVALNPQRRRKIVCPLIFSVALFGGLLGRAAHAQDNYEIQVYGADTVAPKTTMSEMHSNFTVDGTKPLPDSRYAADDLYPTNHAEHETVEITQGINSWSEVGFYIFTTARDADGWQWGRRPHPSPCSRSRQLALAAGGKPFH